MRAEGGGNGETRTYPSFAALSSGALSSNHSVTGWSDFSVNVVSEEFQGKVCIALNDAIARIESLCLTCALIFFS